MTPEEKTALIRRRLSYNPQTGGLTWKQRPVSDFAGNKYPAERLHKQWANRFEGQPALAAPVKSGHLSGSIDDHRVYAHQAAWVLHYGEWPAKSVNHIDGNPANNVIENLRLARHAEVTRNMSMHSHNTSGVMGVYQRGDTKKWVARIAETHIGTFDCKEDAIAARAVAETRYGFHPNHGKRPSRSAAE